MMNDRSRRSIANANADADANDDVSYVYRSHRYASSLCDDRARSHRSIVARVASRRAPRAVPTSRARLRSTPSVLYLHRVSCFT